MAEVLDFKILLCEFGHCVESQSRSVDSKNHSRITLLNLVTVASDSCVSQTSSLAASNAARDCQSL